MEKIANRHIAGESLFLVALLALNLFAVNRGMQGIAAFGMLAIAYVVQQKFIQKAFGGIGSLGIYSFFYCAGYTILSLSSVYYLFGLHRFSVSMWLIISFIPSLWYAANNKKFLYFNRRDFLLKLGEPIGEITRNIWASVAYAAMFFLFAYFYANPVTNGSPTPWINVHWFAFGIFFLLSLFLIMQTLWKKNSAFISIVFLFLAIGLVSIKYPFAYGFDTLLHQAALQYIAEHGKIFPLTPFYVGQYVLEVIIHFYTGWDFSLIERWFMSLMSALLLYGIGTFFLKKNNLSNLGNVVPISVLFMIPAPFIYTSPNAFSLLWAIVSICALTLFFRGGEMNDYRLSGLAAAVSLAVHPLIGLTIIPWIVGAPFIRKMKENKWLPLIFLTLISSLLVTVCFGLYAWLQGGELFINNPIIYFTNFFRLFGDPSWYVQLGSPFTLWLLYFYEKISFAFVIMCLIVFLLVKEKKITGNVFYFLTILLWLLLFYSKAPLLFIVCAVFLFFFMNRKNERYSTMIVCISLGALLSSYVFFSSLTVVGYSFSDQINYASRLVQMAKWLLWPFVVLTFGTLILLMREKNVSLKVFISLILASILTANWYLTYPRNDLISRINVNNVRPVDYKAIDIIYNREGGKEGYLVLANQVVAGAAVQKYGFGPYLDTPLGKILYYSIPMGGAMHERYEKLLTLENFEYSSIEEIFQRTNIRKVYFITTDYWPLAPAAEKQAKALAAFHVTIDNKITVYLFSHDK